MSYHKHLDQKFDPFFWSIIGPLGILAAVMLGIFALIVWEMVVPPNPINVVYKDYGHVTQITNCSTGKYSYNCFVRTNKVYFKSKVDVSDYPGEMLAIGDSIGFQEVHFDNGRIDYSKCRNNRCTSYSTKLWFMPNSD